MQQQQVMMALFVALLLVAALPPLASAATAHDTNTLQVAARMRDVLTTHMSTKTKYPLMTRDEEIETLTHEHTRAEGLHCRPAQLNFVVRHGTRYPTIKDITRISAIHEKLRSQLGSDSSRPWLYNWENPYKAEEAGWLAPVGIDELIAIGDRLRNRFGSRFGRHFRASGFAFESTWKVRTQQSASAFAFGFFGGRHEPVHMHVAAIGEDHELRFFDNCPAYDRAIDQNATATIHHKQYRSSAQMRANLNAFRRLAGDQKLTQKDMEAAYAACAFDVATRDVFDEWCALFNEDMIHSMDYFHDLKHFYKKSHGNALAFEIAAPLLQDVFRSMKQRVEGKSKVEGHFRFAHAETILPLASLLNLSYFDRHASDTQGHFLADTPLELSKTRKFQASVLAPFAANIGFVLYECEDQATEEQSSFRVATLLNEREVKFRECDDQVLCPFPQLEKIFRRWIHEFDFHEQCQ